MKAILNGIFPFILLIMSTQSQGAETEEQMESIKKKRINFGIISDTAPISEWGVTKGGGTGLKGFCGELYDHLHTKEGFEKLQQFEIGYPERFERFSVAKVDSPERYFYGIECTSATITEKRRLCMKTKAEVCDHDSTDKWLKKYEGYNGVFSSPYYTSEVAVIIKKVNVEKLKDPNAKLKIGLLTSEPEKLTTSEIFSIYDEKFIVDDTPYTRREQIREALLNENIDVYASDKILLEDLLYYKSTTEDYKNTLRANGFIVHSNHLTEEPYGIVVYGESNKRENELISYVNAWIKSDSGRQARKTLYEAREKNESEYAEHIS